MRARYLLGINFRFLIRVVGGSLQRGKYMRINRFKENQFRICSL